MRDIDIRNEPIQLYKILKFAGLADNGGAAKAAVAAGQVLVNGETETRKRRQIASGDIIEFMGEKLRIRLSRDTPETVAPDHP